MTIIEVRLCEMIEAETQAQLALQSLRESVREMLERKRRLGQYVVVWRDGKPVRLTQTSPDLQITPTAK